LSILSNKHFITAMIVAPILAIIAYFALDILVGEAPQPAKEGQSYQLVEKPNCRYDSGICGLKNGDFELEIIAEWMAGSRLLLKLKSKFALDGVLLAVVQKGAGEDQPVEMEAVDGEGLLWSLEVSQADPESDRLHLVASSNRVLYFGDAAMKFSSQEAGPSQDQN